MAIIGLDSAQQRRQLMAVAGAAWLLVLVTLMAVAEDFSDEPKPMELMQVCPRSTRRKMEIGNISRGERTEEREGTSSWREWV